MRTALGYVRVSSDEQADRGVGLEAQRQRIRAYCEMKCLHLTTIFEDPGLSGGKPLGRARPSGSRLIRASTTREQCKPHGKDDVRNHRGAHDK